MERRGNKDLRSSIIQQKITTDVYDGKQQLNDGEEKYYSAQIFSGGNKLHVQTGGCVSVALTVPHVPQPIVQRIEKVGWNSISIS